LPLIRKLCASLPSLSLSLSLFLPTSSDPPGPPARGVVFDSALIRFLTATAVTAEQKQREREREMAKELDYPAVLFRQDRSSQFSVSVGTKLRLILLRIRAFAILASRDVNLLRQSRVPMSDFC